MWVLPQSSLSICTSGLMRLGIRISFSEDHHNQIVGASLMETGDLAIAISYSGRTRPTVHAAQIAKARGANARFCPRGIVFASTRDF